MPKRKPWFDEWVQKRVDNAQVEKKVLGANILKLQTSFVPGTKDFDEKFLVTAFVEIAVVVDVPKKVREATYLIEGDGPIAVMIVEILDSVAGYYRSVFEEMDFTNVRRHIAQAVSLHIAPPGYDLRAPVLDEFDQNQRYASDPPLPQPVNNVNKEIAWDLVLAWKKYCLKLSAPYMKYFNDMVMDHNCLPLWCAASMADPSNSGHKGRIMVTDLRTRIQPLMGKLVNSALLDRMIGELSEYERSCRAIDWSNNSWAERLDKIETFWSTRNLLPAWTEFAHLVFLLQPTSACVERSFSMLKLIMGDQQTRSLRDEIEASLMLRFSRGGRVT